MRSSSSAAAALPALATQNFWNSLFKNIVRCCKPLRIRIRRAARTLQLQETLALGEKRSLAIVCCGEERFLIGSAPGSVSLLATLPKVEFEFENALRRTQAIETSK
jgi:flagellar biogenesis protein FliO